jgi:DNA-binding response OmpR family regulator/chromosome segregation ATPase
MARREAVFPRRKLSSTIAKMSKTIKIPEPPKSVVQTPVPDGRRAKRVLVVEGDGVTRWILLNSLRSVGLLVDFAPNSSIALYKFRHRLPDAILLDVQLRGNSGLDLIKAVRKDSRFSRKPIYIFTRANTMSRAVRKVVGVEAAKLFDKATTVPEWLAASVAKELSHTETKTDGAESAQSTAPCTKEELQVKVADLSTQVRTLEQSKEVTQSVAICKELRERAAGIVSSAGQAGMGDVARQAEALESLLDFVCNNPANLDETSLMAVSLGTQTLEALGNDPAIEPPTQFAAVIVDETAASRTAVSDALADAGFVTTTFAAPAQALEYLARNPADTIVTVGAGLAARGMDPAKIQKLPRHQKTPVLAVPSLSALNSTADTPFRFSETSDSNPLALMKLVIKALNLVQKALKPGGTSEATSAPSKPTLTAPPARVEQIAQFDPAFKTAPAAPALPEAPTLPAVAPASPVAQALESKPLAPASSPAVAPKGQASQDGNLILFIEDDPIVLKAYGDRLQREGFQVVPATDGLAALDMLLTIRPQVIVLDLMLPKLHGLEVLKFIRSDGNLRNTPVVVLSNVYMGALSEKAMEAGANLGMPKTQCSPHKLIKVIRKLIEGEAAAADQDEHLTKPEPTDLHPEDSALANAREELLADGPKEIIKMREDCLAYIRTAGNQESMDHLTSLYRGVRFLGGRAGLVGCTNINDLAVAFEAVLFEIVFKASEPTASVLQTIAQAVDCLGRIFESGRLVYGDTHPKYKVLVVDDDAVFNYTTTAALKRANLEVVATQEPVTGLQLLPNHRFDLVMLDINMPGMDGFAFCTELRRIPEYQTTPVLFVTMHAEFQNRARSLLVGGNDMIGKPVSPLELALKVTIRLLDSGAPKEAQQPAAPVTESTATLEAQVSAPETENAPEAGDTPDEGAFAASRHEAVLSSTPEEETPASAELSADPNRGLPETEPAPVMAFQPDSDAPESLQPAGAAAASLADEESPASSAVTLAEPVNEQELVARLKQDKEALVMRTYAVETELHNAKNRIERRDRTIKLLQQKLEEFTAKQAQVEKALAEPEGTVTQAKALETLGNEGEKVSGEGNARLQALDPGSVQRTNAPAGQKAEAAEPVDDLRNQLSALIRAREELSSRLTKELEVSTESSKRIQELEQQLSEQKAALNKTEAESRQQAEELRHQLVATMALEKQAEARAEQLQARCGQLEKDLAALTRTCEELNGRLAREQEASSESGRRIQDLEKQLAQSTAELGTTKAEVSKQTEELRQHVNALTQAQEELSGRFTKEQQLSSESARRIQELEKQLSQQTDALGQTETETRKLTEELRQQLAATKASEKEAATKGEQLQARCSQLEKDLVAANQAREELAGKLGKEQRSASASASRIQELEQQLTQGASALSSIKDEAAKQARDWHRQLVATEAAQKEAQATGQKLQTRCGELEQELAALTQARDEVTGFFTKQQLASSELAKRVSDLENQLAHSQTALGSAKAEAARQAEELRQQLATATKTREELSERLAKEQQAKAESTKREQDLEKQLGLRALEAKQQEAELRHQLSESNAACKQAEAKAQHSQIRCDQLAKDVAALTQAREELNGKFCKEQQAASESAKRAQELEQQFAQLKVESERQAEELVQQLMTKTAAHKQAETKGEQLQARCGQFEKDVAALTQAREELNAALSRVQQTSAESARKVQDLEKQLSQTHGAFEAAKAEATRQTTELRHQLTAANKTCEEVAGRLAKEQHTATEATKRVQELEKQLAQSTSALETTRSEAAKQTGDLRNQLAASTKACEELTGRLSKEQQAVSESVQRVHNLEKQLVQRTAALGSAKAETARQAEDFNSRLAALTQTREELSGKLQREQQVSSEFAKRIQELEGQLAQSAAALRNAQAEAAKQAGELRQQLAASTKAGEELNSRLTLEQQLSTESAKRAQELQQQLTQSNAALTDARAEAAKQTEDLRSQLAASSKAREELSELLTRERQTAAASANRAQELEKQLGLRTLEAKQQEAALRQQLAETSANHKHAEAKAEQLQVRSNQLEQDLAVSSQEREDLRSRLTREQQLVQETGNRIQQLEKQLSQSAMALDQARAEALQQAAELRQQIADTSSAQKHAEARADQFLNRCGQLEKDLAVAVQGREELSGRLAQEQAVSSASAKRVQELEKQQRSIELAFRTEVAELEHRVRQGVESLTRATADLEKERVERNRVEDHAASLAGRMQELHEELSRHLAAEQAAQQRIGKLETNLRQRDEAANRLLAQLQQKVADHQLAEEQLREAAQREEQLQKNVVLFEQARKIYKDTQVGLESKLMAGLNALHESDAHVQKETSERRQLAIELEATRQSWSEETRKRQSAESQFENVTKRLTEIQTRLHNETSERQRLAEALEAAQRNLRDQAQRNELELSKLQTALQLEGVEHKRLEMQVMRLRRVSIESARTGRVYRSSVRQKIGEPLDELCQSARRLLQLELNPEQDQLVQSVLEKALLVQANLVDSAPSPAEVDAADSVLAAADNGAGQPAQPQA